jgi:hypothetical protein
MTQHVPAANTEGTAQRGHVSGIVLDRRNRGIRRSFRAPAATLIVKHDLPLVC